ncbi:hypothetical protein MHYP_G00117380 [Metynnis hypsauchen]
MYERHRRRYTLWSRTDRTADALLLKIHRETEVFYPLESCAKSEESKESSSEENTCAGHSEGVCRSMSVNSLPESESVSDGDSLLSTETDSVFNQSEDTVTLAADSTCEVSVTGSSSTDDLFSLGALWL